MRMNSFPREMKRKEDVLQEHEDALKKLKQLHKIEILQVHARHICEIEMKEDEFKAELEENILLREAFQAKIAALEHKISILETKVQAAANPNLERLYNASKKKCGMLKDVYQEEKDKHIKTKEELKQYKERFSLSNPPTTSSSDTDTIALKEKLKTVQMQLTEERMKHANTESALEEAREELERLRPLAADVQEKTHSIKQQLAISIDTCASVKKQLAVERKQHSETQKQLDAAEEALKTQIVPVPVKTKIPDDRRASKRRATEPVVPLKNLFGKQRDQKPQKRIKVKPLVKREEPLVLSHTNESIGSPEFPFCFSLEVGDPIEVLWNKEWYPSIASYYIPNETEDMWCLQVLYNDWAKKFNEIIELSGEDITRIRKPVNPDSVKNTVKARKGEACFKKAGLSADEIKLMKEKIEKGESLILTRGTLCK